MNININISLKTLLLTVACIVGSCILATSTTDYIVYPLAAVAIAVFSEVLNKFDLKVKASNFFMAMGSVIYLVVFCLNCNKHILCLLIAESILLLLPYIVIDVKPSIEKAIWVIYSIGIVFGNLSTSIPAPISWFTIGIIVAIAYCITVIVSSNRRTNYCDIKNRLLFVTAAAIIISIGTLCSAYIQYLLPILITSLWIIVLYLVTLVKKKAFIKKHEERKREKEIARKEHSRNFKHTIPHVEHDIDDFSVEEERE